MTRIRISLWLASLALAACSETMTTPDPPAPPTLDAQLRQAIGPWGVVPIGAMPAQNPAQVQLGQALFFDKILSGNRDIACATCHQAQASLGDGLSLPIGTGGSGFASSRTLGPGRRFISRNAPSLLNAGLGLYQLFWDARLSRAGFETFAVDSGIVLPGMPNILAAQAMLPVLNRREMRGEPGDKDGLGNPNELAQFSDQATTEVWAAIMVRLSAISEYVTMFDAAFPGRGTSPPRFEDAARALAAFQMQAFTKTGSPFDRYLDRDDFAMTTEQKRGGLLFFGKARCSFCHNGPFLGGQSFANDGAPQIGPGGSKAAPLDLGKGELQSFESYQFAFRVAPLRNIELTAPYMHSGAYATLEAVVGHYNDVPLALRTFDPSKLAPAVRALYHGDAATISAVLATLDGRLTTPLNLTTAEMSDLVAFLKSLTDPAARNLISVVPARVPSGLPIQE
ncbi:MAG: cytochrome c peroxidase [Gemmatimonadota bacterium]